MTKNLEPSRRLARLLDAGREQIRLCRFAFAACLVATAAVHAAGVTHEIQPELPKIPAKIFDVRAHGAKGDGVRDDTAALQSAINAARAAGGGIVEVPAGTYASGPLRLTSNLNVHLAAGATLQLLPIDRYPGGTERGTPFFSGDRLHDLAFTGPGSIDGQGAAWWPLARTPGIKRPNLFLLTACQRVLFEQITLKNSPMFHIWMGGGSEHITVRRVTIHAPSSADPQTPSHNTDACNITGHEVLIEHCDISVGDDNFACSGGTRDVLIQHNTFGTGHGLSIGSRLAGGVSNITVRDCTFNGTDCGIRIKSHRDRGDLVEDLLYENLRMKDVLYPIIIYGTYLSAWLPDESEFRDHTHLTPEIAARYPPHPLIDLTPVYRNITFRNITATTAAGCRAGLIWGLPEAPVRNLILQNVSIQADLPLGIYNAEDVRLENCSITTPTGLNKIATTNAQVVIVP